jgi:carbamoyltransferase
LIAAVEEERFTRVKYAAGFPAQSIRYCLKEAGLRLKDIDHIAIPRNRYVRLARKLFYAARMRYFAVHRTRANARFGRIPTALAEALDEDPKAIRAKVHHVEHHQAHLASSYFASPFERAAVFSADGLGDFASAMWGAGIDSRLVVEGSVPFPHSLGFCYNAVTQYLGFHKFGEEFKVMGLSAYGQPEYLELFRDIVHFDPNRKDLDFRLNLEYFVHHLDRPEVVWTETNKSPTQKKMFSPELERRIGPSRVAGEPLQQLHCNVASSLQTRLEEVYLGMLRKLAHSAGTKNLCVAGGVALNCLANGKILDETPFERVYIPPAPGDSGLSVGAALYVWSQKLGNPRNFQMNHAYWGPSFTSRQLRDALECSGIRGAQYPIAELHERELLRRTAALVADGKIVAWFQGRTEWGPRSLGNRSILADPRRPEMKEILNRRVKHREFFRPFAPSVLSEAASEWFERSHPAPFMTMAYRVRKEKREFIPSPTHVDGTGRLQTVAREMNPRFWQLIKAFDQITGVPVVLNTSFNDNEPIVNCPEEALDCFSRTETDALVLGDYLVTKPNGLQRGNSTETLEPNLVHQPVLEVGSSWRSLENANEKGS